MPRKPETNFTGTVHKRLPSKKVPHREKMSNPWRGGTADWWYSGSKADLWVEYKYVTKLPVNADVKVDLSPLQRDWIEGRYKEGRNVAVIVGCPSGGVVLMRGAWRKDIPVSFFRSALLTREQLARWILDQTGT